MNLGRIQNLNTTPTTHKTTQEKVKVYAETKTPPSGKEEATIMDSFNKFILAYTDPPTNPTPTDTQTPHIEQNKPVEISELNVLGKQIAANLTSPIGEMATYLFSGDALNDIKQTGDYLASGSFIEDASNYVGNDLLTDITETAGKITDYVTSGEIIKDIESGIDYLTSGKVASDMASSIGQNIISEDSIQNGELAQVMAKNAELNGESGVNFCQTFLNNAGSNENHSECIELMRNCVTIVTDMKLTSIKTTDQFTKIDEVFKNDDNPITKSIFTQSTIEAAIDTLKTNETSKGMNVLYGILKAVTSTILLVDQKTTGIIKKTINNKIKDKLKSMVIKTKLKNADLKSLQESLSQLKEETQPGSTKSDNKSSILAAIKLKDTLSKLPKSPQTSSDALNNDKKLSNLLLKNFKPNIPDEEKTNTQRIVTDFLQQKL